MAPPIPPTVPPLSSLAAGVAPPINLEKQHGLAFRDMMKQAAQVFKQQEKAHIYGGETIATSI